MKSKLAIFFLLILSFVIHWKWVFVPQLFGGGDFSSFLKSPQALKALFALPSAWDPLWGNGLGVFNIIMSVYPMYISMALLSKIGFDLIWIIKLTNFLPVIILTPLCSYLLFRRLSGSIFGAFVGSIVYSYNTYILLLQKGGIMLINISYAIVPLFFYLSLLSITQKSYRLSLVTGLVGFAIASFDFRLFYLTALLQVIYLLWYLICNRFKNLLLNTSLLLLPLMITSLLSAYWLLPTYFSGKISHNTAIATGLFNWDISLVKVLGFFHPFWDGGRNSQPGTVQPFPEYLLLLPVLSVYGLLRIKRFPELSFYLLVLLLGVFLTKQSAPPFPDLYIWLFKNFPGFNAFRESSKFYLFIGLGYGSLLSASMAVFLKSSHRVIKYIPAIFIITIFLLETRVFITGQVNGMFLPKNIPREYLNYRQKMLLDTTFGRTLWVPSYSQWSYEDIFHPKVSAYLIYIEKLQSILESNPLYHPVINPSSTAVINYQLLNLFNQQFSPYYLQLLGIKYVAIPSVNTVKEDDLFDRVYGLYSDRQALVKFLNSQTYLVRDNSFTGFDVYIPKLLPSLFFTTISELSLTNLDTIKSIPSVRLPNNQFQILVPNPSSPLFLHFSESADDGWQLVESRIGMKVSHDPNSEILGLNAFTIYPDSKLPPGVVRTFVLSYYPQMLTQLGIVISFTVLTLTIGLVIFYGKKERCINT